MNTKKNRNSIRRSIKPFRDTRSFKQRVQQSAVHIAPRYDSSNTTEVLFRLNASVWPNVFPWCVANTAMAFAIHYSNTHVLDISTSDKAHVFMSLMVSFLVVTRCKICLGRYMKARTGLSEVMRTSKELIHHAVAFTRCKNPNEDGTKWRVAMANRTICMLRVVVAILRFPSSRTFVCELSDLADDDRDALKLAVGRSNERSPHVLTLFLRSLIASHEHKISPPLAIPQEMLLYQYTSDFLTAYSNIMSSVATPHPFPLVQMTRTFLFVYVFSLPYALSDDFDHLAPYLVVVFFMTYGFIGLELISIEMDDPFGNDPNDFKVEAAAVNTYKDILVCIEDIDGTEAREKVEANFNLSIRDRIRKTLQHHRKYTRVSEWGGSTNDSTIDDISQKIQERVRRRRNSDISAMSGLLKSIKQGESFDSNDLLYSPAGAGDKPRDIDISTIQSPMVFELAASIKNVIPEVVVEEDLSEEDDALSHDLSYAESGSNSNNGGVELCNDDNDKADEELSKNAQSAEMALRTGESVRSDHEAFMASLDQTRLAVSSPETESYSMNSSPSFGEKRWQDRDSIRSEQKDFMAAIQRFDEGRGENAAPLYSPGSPLSNDSAISENDVKRVDSARSDPQIVMGAPAPALAQSPRFNIDVADSPQEEMHHDIDNDNDTEEKYDEESGQLGREGDDIHKDDPTSPTSTHSHPHQDRTSVGTEGGILESAVYDDTFTSESNENTNSIVTNNMTTPDRAISTRPPLYRRLMGGMSNRKNKKKKKRNLL